MSHFNNSDRDYSYFSTACTSFLIALPGDMRRPYLSAPFYVEQIDGGILAAIEEVPKFIRRNTRMAGKFGAMKRRDIPEYPVDGIREELTNAFVHANYEIPGTRLFVAIYDDKLEIQNPGIMPPGMNTVSQLGADFGTQSAPS